MITITTRSHPDGIQITGVKALAGILRQCHCGTQPDIYYQIIIPRKGGKLSIYEHVDAASYVPVDPDEICIHYCHPRTMQQIADDIRDALDNADAMDACR